MEGYPLVRAAHDHHDHPGVLEYQIVANWGLQEMAMLVDPAS